MSERTVTPGGPTGLPPTVPPSGSAGRQGGSSSAPQRVSTATTRSGNIGSSHGEADRPTTQRAATNDSPYLSDKSKSRSKAPGPRRVRLAVSRVDPWSVMKLSFLLSIALGIGLVVATATVWSVLNQMEVFAEIRSLVEQAEVENQFGTLLEYLEFSRVLSVATVVAVVDIVLLTALATLGAFIYNLVAAMVGGLHLTLTDD